MTMFAFCSLENGGSHRSVALIEVCYGDVVVVYTLQSVTRACYMHHSLGTLESHSRGTSVMPVDASSPAIDNGSSSVSHITAHSF